MDAADDRKLFLSSGMLPLQTVVRWLDLGRNVAIEECPVEWQEAGWLDVSDRDAVRKIKRGTLPIGRDTEKPRRAKRAGTRQQLRRWSKDPTEHPVRMSPPWRPFARLLKDWPQS